MSPTCRQDLSETGHNWGGLAALGVVLLLMSGCRHAELCGQRCVVSSEVNERVGQPLGEYTCPGERSMPPGVEPADGLTEEEAIALALWNNAAYQETLSLLGISEAQLFDAGLLQDPQLIVLFPLGPKQLEFTAFQFVDALWLQPIRIRAAELGLSRVADQMVQNGLDVIRDVRVAHANLVLAQQSAALAGEGEQIRTEIADLAQKRLEAGDISELEANDSRVQALAAKASAARAKMEVSLAQRRLLAVMGVPAIVEEMVAIRPESADLPARDEAELVREALAMRPDLRAAEIGIGEAERRLKLAETQILSFEAGIDANAEGTNGFEASPALRMTLPIFNRNRGNIAIAAAQLEQAQRRYETIRDQVTLDVRQSYTAARQAEENLRIVQGELLPALTSAVELAKRNFQQGGTSYILVLQSTGQFLDARAQELQLSADLQRSLAELERGVGHRLAGDGENLEPSEELDVPAPMEP